MPRDPIPSPVQHWADQLSLEDAQRQYARVAALKLTGRAMGWGIWHIDDCLAALKRRIARGET
jgi:hypothetical protein